MLGATLRNLFARETLVNTVYGEGKLIRRESPDFKPHRHLEINSYRDMLVELESGQRIYVSESEILKKEHEKA